MYHLEIWRTSTTSCFVFLCLIIFSSSFTKPARVRVTFHKYILIVPMPPHLPYMCRFLFTYERRILKQQGSFSDSSQHPCLTLFSIATPWTQRLQLQCFLHTPGSLVVASAPLHTPFPLLGCPFVSSVRSKLCFLMPSECCLTLMLPAMLKMEDSVKKCSVG